jgi:hypothetical protein
LECSTVDREGALSFGASGGGAGRAVGVFPDSAGLDFGGGFVHPVPRPEVGRSGFDVGFHPSFVGSVQVPSLSRYTSPFLSTYTLFGRFEGRGFGAARTTAFPPEVGAGFAAGFIAGDFEGDFVLAFTPDFPESAGAGRLNAGRVSIADFTAGRSYTLVRIFAFCMVEPVRPGGEDLYFHALRYAG